MTKFDIIYYIERRHTKRRASFSKMGSPSHGDYGPMARGSGQRELDYHHHQPDGDHYIPNYERDGYTPAPRYSNLQQESHNSPGFGGDSRGRGGERGAVDGNNRNSNNNDNNNNSGINTGGGYSMMGGGNFYLE